MVNLSFFIGGIFFTVFGFLKLTFWRKHMPWPKTNVHSNSEKVQALSVVLGIFAIFLGIGLIMRAF